MAQVISTLCDPHLTEDDIQVAGLPYRVGVNLPGESRWGWFEVDLCPEHAEALTALSLSLSKYGRPFQPDDTVTTPRRKVRPSDLARRKYAHPDLADPANPFVCDVDGCGRAFPKAQGLSMHKRRAHGYRPLQPR